ncbi:hypothetical protein [Streptomyces sp. NPDC056464]|uniref:hypothetical protein n=1 Tax=Streptomyces sp. NPDC056464 TaxID=3345828 RepID=UPI0036AF1421
MTSESTRPSERDGGDAPARATHDPAAFEALVTHHSVALHGYLARRAPTVADDLLSEVWLQAYASRGTSSYRSMACGRTRPVGVVARRSDESAVSLPCHAEWRARPGRTQEVE